MTSPKGLSKNNLPSWASDDGQLREAKNRSLPGVNEDFSLPADGRQLAAKWVSYSWTEPNDLNPKDWRKLASCLASSYNLAEPTHPISHRLYERMERTQLKFNSLIEVLAVIAELTLEDSTGIRHGFVLEAIRWPRTPADGIRWEILDAAPLM